MDTKFTNQVTITGCEDAIKHFVELMETNRVSVVFDDDIDWYEFINYEYFKNILMVIIETKNSSAGTHLEYIYEYLLKEVKMCDGLRFEGQYYNEDYSELGAFIIDEHGWDHEEAINDESKEEWEKTNPDKDYWDYVVSPIFTYLKKTFK